MLYSDIKHKKNSFTFGTTLVTYSASSLGCPEIRTLTNGSMMSPLSLCSDLGRCWPLMILIRNFLAATNDGLEVVEEEEDLGGSEIKEKEE